MLIGFNKSDLTYEGRPKVDYCYRQQPANKRSSPVTSERLVNLEKLEKQSLSESQVPKPDGEMVNYLF
jgi:hypothetical protein